MSGNEKLLRGRSGGFVEVGGGKKRTAVGRESRTGKFLKRKISKPSRNPADPDEVPEQAEAWFADADLYDGDNLVRRGRPKSDRPKQAISIRLDAEILAFFRGTGDGWQTRIGEVLRAYVAERTGKG